MGSKKAKILIVEDDRVLSDAISSKLLNSDFEVSLAFNGVEGIRRVNSDNPDLILLDIIMPTMDGLTMLKEIRDNGVDTPVIMLTNSNEPDKIAQAIKEECAGYLVKSNYTLEDIVTTINKILQENGQ